MPRPPIPEKYASHARRYGAHVGLQLCKITGNVILRPVDSLLRFFSLKGLADMYRREGGAKAWFRGNSATLMRIIPFCGFQVLSFEALKIGYGAIKTELAAHSPLESDKVTAGEVAVLGGAAGAIAAMVVYPLDLARAVLANDIPRNRKAMFKMNRRSHPLGHVGGQYRYTGIAHVLQSEYTRGGIRALYRGSLPTMAGLFLFLGLNSFALRVLMPLVPEKNDGSGLGEPMIVMSAGLWASRLAQVASYPCDVVRHCMQVDRTQPSMTGTMRTMWQQGGPGAFYRGLTMNLYKIFPSVTITYLVYTSLIGLVKKDGARNRKGAFVDAGRIQ